MRLSGYNRYLHLLPLSKARGARHLPGDGLLMAKMSPQGTASIIAKVSVRCEACGHEYAYERTLRDYARRADKAAATAAAEEGLARQVDRVQSGDVQPVASDRPCPQCGYMQSWMVESVRRRRSWQWALATAASAYLLGLLGLIFLKSEGWKPGDCLTLVTPLGASALVFFIARSIILWAYQPNRGRDIPPHTHAPAVRFHRL